MNFNDDDILQFLPRGKFTAANISNVRDATLETTTEEIVLSKFRPFFDITDWDTSPPILVKSITSMRIAAQYYTEHYAEDDTETAYGESLFRRSDELIDGIITGSISLAEVSDKASIGYVEDIGDPIFEIGQQF